MTQQELEDRLLKFSSNIIQFANRMPAYPASIHLAGQLIRSGTAPCLMYGEACAAESLSDFIHKMALTLKELRETKMNLRLALINGYAKEVDANPLIDECDQLNRIFWKSIDTAKRNRLKSGAQ